MQGSQNVRGWKGPLWVTLSNPSAEVYKYSDDTAFTRSYCQETTLPKYPSQSSDPCETTWPRSTK